MLLIVYRLCAHDSFSQPTSSLPLTSSPRHPVELLHQRASAEFDTLVSRQSRNAIEAIGSYERRYGRTPPPGFQQWVEYAMAQKSPIIDDFDMILENLGPFHKMTAEGVLHLMKETTQGENDRVSRCSFARGSFSGGCSKFSAAMEHVLGDATKHIPNVALIVNFLDEPSVLRTGKHGEGLGQHWLDMSGQSIASLVSDACRNTTHQKPFYASHSRRVNTHGLPMVQNVDAEKDLCLHPEYNTSHGFVMSPASLRHIAVEFPLLSRAAPYPFSDIVFPSPHYVFQDNRYSESMDKEFLDKKNVLFWAGTTTGGYWRKDAGDWRHAQRQRFAQMANTNAEERNFTYLDYNPDHIDGGYSPYVSVDFNRALYDARLTKVHQCDAAACQEQKTFFKISKNQETSPSKHYDYRFVFDVDGNSYSGRFYKYLEAHTVPLKMTIFREWHDERLVPWLHYIPVSQSMEEIPELMRYLATTQEGQAISLRIAEAGREWYRQALAPVHQGIYLYRLLLELAWLQDESRPLG